MIIIPADFLLKKKWCFLSCSYLLNNKVNANLLNNKLNIAYLNVCGLKSKLLNSDISYMIKKYDILIFVETITDEFDEN
jgi:hypothetical protein